MLATLMAAIRVVERAFLAVSMIAMSMHVLHQRRRSRNQPETCNQSGLDRRGHLVRARMAGICRARPHARAPPPHRHDGASKQASSAVARTIQKIINLTGLVFCIFLAKIGFDLAVFIFDSGQISPTLGISMAGLYAPLPIGFALLGLRYLLELLGVQDRTTITSVAVE